MNVMEMIVGLASHLIVVLTLQLKAANLTSPSPDILQKIQKAAVLLDWLACASALPIRAWTKPL